MNDIIFEQRESSIRGYCRAYPTVFKSSSNARMVDEDGNSYIDFFAGAGVLNFGHNNPKMKKAIIEFIESDGVTQSLDMYTSTKREFIEQFVEVVLEPRNMPHKLQFMGPTGTNAVEAALKLARRVTGRMNVVAFEHGFHGMTLGALAATANSKFRNASGVPLTHILRQPFCEENNDPKAAIEGLRKLGEMFKDPSGGIEPPAAFIIESLQAEGGVRMAHSEWLREVQQLAQDLSALFIIDDIQSGCGRTGSYFSFDEFCLEPDIVCLAKGIGGFGTPLAMNLVKPEFDSHWSPGEHTGTFRGQGISFVAGKVGFEYFKDDEFLKDVKLKGAKMRETLEAIAKKHEQHKFAVRGRGMMQGLDLLDGELAKKIATECFHAGLLVGPCGSGGRVIKLIPPLTIGDKELEDGLEIFSSACSKVI